MEERSRALQHRVSDILRLVRYEGVPSSPLHQALTQYRDRAGNLGSNLPISSLKAAERTALEQANSPVSRYKALLAGHVADQLKAGKRNLVHSLSYRPFDTCLLDATTWASQRAALLFQTNLLDLGEPGLFLDALQVHLGLLIAAGG